MELVDSLLKFKPVFQIQVCEALFCPHEFKFGFNFV